MAHAAAVLARVGLLQVERCCGHVEVTRGACCICNVLQLVVGCIQQHQKLRSLLQVQSHCAAVAAVCWMIAAGMAVPVEVRVDCEELLGYPVACVGCILGGI